MDKILGSVGIKIPFLSALNINDNDAVDRMSHRVSVVMLVAFSIIVSSKQFVGSAINCWVPAHFTDEQLEYTNDFCWIRNTYYLPHSESIPEHDERDNIPYYQWVSLILLLQALMFYLPHATWSAINAHSGIDIKNLVEAGHVFVATEMSEVREKTLSHMTMQMDRFLSSTRTQQGTGWVATVKSLFSSCCQCCGRTTDGHGLTVAYLVIKLLYIANAITQLFLLDALLGFSFHSYGSEVLSALVAGVDWTETSSRFPRTAMCDLKVRRLGDVHRYSVECVLAINLFNEKIFLFLWFWLIAIIIFTSVSLLIWLARLVRDHERRHYVRQHLHAMKRLKSGRDRKLSRKFIDNYLRHDGLLVLRILACNTDTITMTEFINQLWKNFSEKRTSDDQGMGVGEGEEVGRSRREGSRLCCGLCAVSSCCRR